MCDNNHSSLHSVQVSAAELASLVESATPVLNKLCLIIATKDFVGFDREALLKLRDWVDQGFASLVELCEGAAERIDFELSELEHSPAPTHPSS